MISPPGVLPLTQADRKMLLKNTPPEFKFTKEKLHALKTENKKRKGKAAAAAEAAAAAAALENKSKPQPRTSRPQQKQRVRANFTWDVDDDSVDWRTPRLLYSDGVVDTTCKVTPPAIQGTCGSCYMFAAVAQIASYCAIKNRVAAQPINPTAYLENCACLFSKNPSLQFDTPPCVECPQPPDPNQFLLTDAADMAYMADTITDSCMVCKGGITAFILKMLVDALQLYANEYPTKNVYIAQGTRVSYPFASVVNSTKYTVSSDRCTNRNYHDSPHKDSLEEHSVAAICKIVSSLNLFPHSNLEIYKVDDAAPPDYLPMPKNTKIMFFDFSGLDCVADREVLVKHLLKTYGPISANLCINDNEVNEAESRQAPFIVYPESVAPNQEPGHSVLLIGYTTLNTAAGEKDVWIIKNSYSTWGNSQNVYYLPRGTRTWTQADWSKWGSWGAQSILTDSQMLCVLYTGEELMCQVKYPTNYYDISNEEPCNKACLNSELDLGSACTACKNAALQPPTCWACKNERKSVVTGCEDCKPQYAQNELCDACANPDHSVLSDCMLCTRGGGFDPADCSKCGTGYTGANCDTCAAGYILSSDGCIPGCAQENYDYAATPPCSACLAQYDIQSSCKQCLPGYDPASRCTRSLNESGSECDSASACQNGGTCTGINSCTCPPGWEGQQCQTQVSLCQAKPCQNGGTCTGANQCQCAPGWTGAQCQTSQCADKPCQNGGTCSGVNTCTCAPGWTGAQCQTSQCADNPCQNGGTCSGVNTCTCAPGWTGAQCQTSQCADNPCQNGGTCSGVNTCTCPRDTAWGQNFSGSWGYAGPQCQYEECYSGLMCTPPDTCTYSDTFMLGNLEEWCA